MKLTLYILYFITAIFLTGCYQPRYDDNFERIELKHIKQGEQKDYFWAEWDTLSTPTNSDFIKPEHLSLLKDEPSHGDWDNIFRKALLLHENAHCINDHQCKWWFMFGPRKRWTNEREGYGTEIIYLLRRGIKFDNKMIDHYIKVTQMPLYKDMCTAEQAKKWLFGLLEKYKLPENGMPVIAGDGLNTKQPDFTKYLEMKGR